MGDKRIAPLFALVQTDGVSSKGSYADGSMTVALHVETEPGRSVRIGYLSVVRAGSKIVASATLGRNKEEADQIEFTMEAEG